MGRGVTLIGVIVPRVLMVVWWLNDPGRWQTIFGGILWPALGFVFLPRTTLCYVVFQPTGFDVLNDRPARVGGPGRPRDLGDRGVRRAQAGVLLPRSLNADSRCP